MCFRDINIELENRKLRIVKTYLLHIDDRQKKLYNNIANKDLGDKLMNSFFLNEFFQMGIRGMYSTFLNLVGICLHLIEESSMIIE